MNPTQLSRPGQRLGGPARRVRRQRGGKATAEPKTFALLYLYAMWAVTVLDLHRWAGRIGPGILQKGQALMFYGLILLLLFELPRMMSNAKSERFVVPLLALVAAAMVTVPFAMSSTAARSFTQMLALYYLLVVATVAFVRTPRQALPILLLFPLQYIWWAPHSGVSGRVAWHSIYANYDAFGPLCAMGMGFGYYFALAAKSKRFKWVCLGLASFCVLGVVASFARGAFLSAAVVGFIIWKRSPRKVVTTAAVLGGVIIVLIGASVLFPDTFWPEMASSFTEGTKEGTGEDRFLLWTAATKVFLKHPLFGVGAGNFGPVAVDTGVYAEVLGDAYNPNLLYDKNLHSVFFQILSEFGLAGSLAFIWVLVDFWKRNRALQNDVASRAWALTTGGDYDLKYIMIALEVGMVAFLASGFFYAQLFNHWFFTLVAANAMMYVLIKPLSDRLQAAPSTRARRVAGQPGARRVAGPPGAQRGFRRGPVRRGRR